ncbi:hypothetical protein [Peptoniphilus duerdenii]|uniref:hypothetical protein n=1 Tax=Peptoniphilus duerdenii TaxID=507750 RepID=UPI00288B3D44|nr:hypothetical protein [Peptoniphilus duerdenii]
MLLEVYYENYKKNCRGAYWEEPLFTPYGVYDRDPENRESFYDFLISEGFECVNWNSSYPLVLVNLELKRFGLIYLPIAHGCVDSRRYTIQEFLDEVYYPKKDS